MMQDLGQVQGLTPGCMVDLFAATEPIRDNQGFWWRLPDRREKHSFSDRLRHCILILVESEWACHSATAGIEIF